MSQESVVYGCIKDVLYDDGGAESGEHRCRNREVVLSLPSIEDWPLISREMFAMPAQGFFLADSHTDVIHFGSAYKGVEYEWQTWISQFEQLLKQMYWVSATVHLETELSGSHTFSWESDDLYHEPSSGELAVRCEWSREAAGF